MCAEEGAQEFRHMGQASTAPSELFSSPTTGLLACSSFITVCQYRVERKMPSGQGLNKNVPALAIQLTRKEISFGVFVLLLQSHQYF